MFIYKNKIKNLKKSKHKQKQEIRKSFTSILKENYLIFKIKKLSFILSLARFKIFFYIVNKIVTNSWSSHRYPRNLLLRRLFFG